MSADAVARQRASAAAIALRGSAQRRLEGAHALALRHRPLWPAAGLVVATVVAYHFTLTSLYDYLRLDTPLAYLPLLPFFTLWLALSTAHRYREAQSPIADRQVDFIIGIPLLVIAVVMITFLPALSSTYYWTDRPDVLSLALFVSAGVIMLYGVHWFWRVRAAMFFLVLMWPALYIRLMPTLLTQFTDATNRALAVVVSHLPMKVSLDPAQSGLIWVHQNGQPDIVVSVGSACSGANGVLGFALIGGALLTIASGARWRKLLWFAAGLALIFALNVLRLTSILGLAEAGQPSIALGAYHSVIGMVLFAIAIVVMMRGLPLFGLRSRGLVEARALEDRPAPAPSRPRPRWRKLVAASGALLVVAFVGFANHELRPYAAFLDGTGAPTVKAFDLNTKPGAALPAGVSVKQSDGPFTWATQYFGANSLFVRYQVSSAVDGVVYADVVDTDDRGALDAYGLQNCFLFHNYDIRTSRRIDLGSGVVGLLLNYSDPTTKAHWSTVSWAWPVLRDGQTFYERVALTADLSPGQEADFRPDGNPLHSFVIDLLNRTSGSAEDASVDTMYASADTKLEGLAGRLVVTSVDAANR